MESRFDPKLIFRPCEHVRSIVWSGEPILPDAFFKTTGDGLAKCRQLRKEIAAIIPTILAHPPTRSLQQLACEVHAALAETDQLIHLLTQTRGKAVHLQAEWIDGACHCWPKNPRTEASSEKRRQHYRPLDTPAPVPAPEPPPPAIKRTKIMLEDAREIRRLRASMSLGQLAQKYGITRPSIVAIVQNRVHAEPTTA